MLCQRDQQARPAVGVPPLRMVFVETTDRCNLACRHCRMDERQGSALPGEWLREALAPFRPRPMVVLSGGEPLLRPDIVPLAASLVAAGHRVSLASNGTLFDEVRVRALQEAGIVRVAVSLDGADAATHDRVRGIDGAFAGALRGIRILRSQGLPFQINTTLTRINRASLGEILELARREGAVAVHLFVLVPVGCGLEVPPAERLTPETYGRLLEELYLGSPPLPIRLTCAPQFARLQVERGGIDAGGMERMQGGCLAGRHVLFISAQGDVSPCGYFGQTCGNIGRQSLAGIWKDAALFQDLRRPEKLQGACGHCAWQHECSGCRARALAETGNPFATDPICPWGG